MNAVGVAIIVAYLMGTTFFGCPCGGGDSDEIFRYEEFRKRQLPVMLL